MAAISVPNNTTSVETNWGSCSTKSDSGVTGYAIVFIITKESDSCLETASHALLNPSMLQCGWMWASAPTRVFHVSRPSVVLRYCSSAINECKERAVLFITMKFICCPIFIPRQILVKGVFQ